MPPSYNTRINRRLKVLIVLLKKTLINALFRRLLMRRVYVAQVQRFALLPPGAAQTFNFLFRPVAQWHFAAASRTRLSRRSQSVRPAAPMT